MHNIVSVDEAITKGQRIVNYPTFAIMISTWLLSFYLGGIVSWWILPIGFVFSFILSWLYWSFMITKWRLWAFENVRNVHQLKQRAIQENLIWPDGSIYEKTEIRTATEKRRWEALQLKFNGEDIFYDDPTVESETVIYYSQRKSIESLIVAVVLLAGSIFLFFEKEYLYSAVSIGLAIFLGYTGFKKTHNKQPQIIINDKGITTVDTPFYSWRDISNEEVVYSGSGKSISANLIYAHPAGNEKLNIEDYDMDINKLSELLILYRGRYNKKHQLFQK